MRVLGVLACVVGACGAGSPPIDDAGVSDAAMGPDLAPCTLSSIPLDDYPATGTPERLYVRVGYKSAPAALLVDTGSELTFIQEPIGSPDPMYGAGSVTLGCESIELIGRPEGSLGSTAGLPVIGTLGTDQLLNGPTKVDFTHQLITLHASGSAFPEAAAWPNAPYDVADGIVLAHASLDGTAVRLEVDTGSGSVIWVGVQPNPGDTAIQSEDAEGNPITIYMGTVTLDFGTWSGTVPCGRIPSWPAFDQGTAEMGGNIQGLIGLSALGDGFVFDTDAKVVRVNE